MLVQSLGWEDPLEKDMATTPVFLPGKIHRQRNLVGVLQSVGSQRVGHDQSNITRTHFYHPMAWQIGGIKFNVRKNFSFHIRSVVLPTIPTQAC